MLGPKPLIVKPIAFPSKDVQTKKIKKFNLKTWPTEQKLLLLLF